MNSSFSLKNKVIFYNSLSMIRTLKDSRNYVLLPFYVYYHSSLWESSMRKMANVFVGVAGDTLSNCNCEIVEAGGGEDCALTEGEGNKSGHRLRSVPPSSLCSSNALFQELSSLRSGCG